MLPVPLKNAARAVAASGRYHRAKVPGFLVCLGIAVTALLLSETIVVFLWGSPVRGLSAVTIAAAIGLMFPARFKERAALKPGFEFCIRHVLRFGIVLIGLRLSFTDVLRIGIDGLPVMMACIGVALAAAWLVSRYLAVPLKLAVLISAGTSICGLSAILSLGPALEADDDEMSYALTVITIFGFLALFIYPFVAAAAFPANEHLVGLFLGTAIHDTAQVAGASLMYEQTYHAMHVLDVATVTKLFRNLFIVAVIPVVCIAYQRLEKGRALGRRRPWHAYVPTFIVGFFLMTLVRTVGDLDEAAAFGFLPLRGYWDALEFSELASNNIMALAMAAAGMNTSFARLRRIGLRPLAVGLMTAALVGVVSFVVIKAGA